MYSLLPYKAATKYNPFSSILLSRQWFQMITDTKAGCADINYCHGSISPKSVYGRVFLLFFSWSFFIFFSPLVMMTWMWSGNRYHAGQYLFKMGILFLPSFFCLSNDTGLAVYHQPQHSFSLCLSIRKRFMYFSKFLFHKFNQPPFSMPLLYSPSGSKFMPCWVF